MGKIKNTDFFREQSDVPCDENPTPKHVSLPLELLEAVKDAAGTLNETGFHSLSADMNDLYRLAVNKRFTVAFVGEFNRGKSTLLNSLFGKEVLPTGVIPPTDILASVVYGENPHMTVYVGDVANAELPVAESSWEELMSADFVEMVPEGHVTVEIDDQWLVRYGVEFVDIPGNVDGNRAKLIEKYLLKADAAVMAVEAGTPLSVSELSFIKRKIMARGVPYFAVVVTKLDLVEETKRADCLSYIAKRLKEEKIETTVIVPGEVEIPGLEAGRFTLGIDGLKALIVKWMTDENRSALLERWLSTNVLSIVNSAKALLLRQKKIDGATQDEKERLVRERELAVLQMHGKWEELKNEFDKRCESCVAEFTDTARKGEKAIIEKLQQEVQTQSNPKDWWEKDYSGLVSRELEKCADSLDNTVSVRVSNDINWLNVELNRQFREILGVETDDFKFLDDSKANVRGKSLNLKDLKKENTSLAVAGSVLTVGVAVVLKLLHGPVVVPTLITGAGAFLGISALIGKDMKKQKAEISEQIAKQVSDVIRNAVSDSTVKIQIIYHNVISELMKAETRWMAAEKDQIKNNAVKECDDSGKITDGRLKTIEELAERFAKL